MLTLATGAEPLDDVESPVAVPEENADDLRDFARDLSGPAARRCGRWAANVWSVGLAGSRRRPTR
ncbi:MAG: hypothetical protein IPG50_32675 [Myxococcales bacterium]|nr:hypothetical protein [Myxococcales bacterium]